MKANKSRRNWERRMRNQDLYEFVHDANCQYFTRWQGAFYLCGFEC